MSTTVLAQGSLCVYGCGSRKNTNDSHQKRDRLAQPGLAHLTGLSAGTIPIVRHQESSSLLKSASPPQDHEPASLAPVSVADPVSGLYL